jgi:XTP/dITP diphosphohydrolase
MSESARPDRLPIVLATHNRNKVDEYQRLLRDDFASLVIVPYDGPEPLEDGVRFAENALTKARAAAAHTGRIALADDSGIGVDVLGGAPGVFSARWAGSRRDPEANVALVLDQLRDIRSPHRGASFSCAIALVVPDAEPKSGSSETVVEGTWRGSVALERRGENGFGYDPIFVPDGMQVTAAQLTPEQKDAVSHRALAFEKLRAVLHLLLAGGRGAADSSR